MFELARISLHNWYLLEGRDLEVAGSVALVGQTGAGKSAIVDAIQTVMAGNNRNVIRLNSAAGEARDRHVLDYCLGCVTDVEEGKPQRSRAETILALTFANRETGQQAAFGLLLAADEEEPGGERTIHRFVVKGGEFRLADFIEVEPGGARYMPTHDALVQRMKERFGAGRDNLTFHASALAFVQEYLTAMRPRSSPDPQRFLRSFSNALAAREIKDPTDFIRRFVLDANPLNVRRVRESIATWRELQAEAARLGRMLRSAQDVRSRFVAWARHKVDVDGGTFLAAHAERLRLDIEGREAQRRKAALEEELSGFTARDAEIEDQAKRYQDENEQDVLLAAQSDGALRRKLIENEQREFRQARDTGSAQLTRILSPYLKALHLERIKDFLPAWTAEGVGAAAQLAALSPSGNPAGWAEHWTDLGRLSSRVAALTRAEDSLRPQEAAVTETLSDLRREAVGLDAQVKAAGEAGTLLSSQTLLLRQELGRRGIRAVALPDVVEVPDERWAFALEALLGAYREALLVPADRVDEAFGILYRNRGRLDGCRLINTRKTRSAQARLPAGSIAAAATTDDPDARGFIDAHVGRYVRADNEAELTRLDQGIMPDGKTSQGLGLRVFRERQPILGKTAQAAALEAAHTRRAELSEIIASTEQRQALLQGGLRLLASLLEAAPSAEIEAEGRRLDDAIKRLATLAEDARSMDEADGDGPNAAIRERNQLILAAKREQADLRRSASKLHEELGGLGRDMAGKIERVTQLTKLEAELSTLQGTDREARLVRLSGGEPIDRLRTRLENMLGLNYLGREAAELRKEEGAARERAADGRRHLDESRRRADGELRKYLNEFEPSNTLPVDADEAEKLFWSDGRVARIEAHELLPHTARLDEARAEMEHMLKEDLLAKLDERLQGVRRQLDLLNRRLAGHTFVGQTYAFRSRMNERLKPLAELARLVAADPKLGFDALGRLELAAPLRSALSHVERIVGSDEDATEIEDYRNYHEFELELRQGDEKPVAFSSVLGKLSGGQREAPYYVAIAASMVSVYYPGGKAGDTDGMGLVLFDEAFRKLDVRNTRALLDLFRGLGLQVVIAAPEANRATFLESVDTIVTVARQPGTADVYVEASRPGPKARAAMRAANPEHVGIEGFRAAADAVGGGTIAAKPATIPA